MRALRRMEGKEKRMVEMCKFYHYTDILLF